MKHPKVPGVRFAVVEQAYLVGDDGSVWSNLTRSGTLPPDWRRVAITRRTYGARYCVVCLRTDSGKGKVICRYVHRLVLEGFVGSCPEGMVCLHHDGNTANNTLENLRWGTQVENAADKIRHGTHPFGSRSANAKITEADVIKIRRRRSAGEFMTTIAKDFGIKPATVQGIVSGKQWRHVKEACPN